MRAEVIGARRGSRARAPSCTGATRAQRRILGPASRLMNGDDTASAIDGRTDWLPAGMPGLGEHPPHRAVMHPQLARRWCRSASARRDAGAGSRLPARARSSPAAPDSADRRATDPTGRRRAMAASRNCNVDSGRARRCEWAGSGMACWQRGRARHRVPAVGGRGWSPLWPRRLPATGTLMRHFLRLAFTPTRFAGRHGTAHRGGSTGSVRRPGASDSRRRICAQSPRAILVTAVTVGGRCVPAAAQRAQL